MLLDDKFIEKYKNKQPKFGYNGLGYIAYKRSYSRVKENGQKEEWWETIRRVIEGAQEIGANYTKEEAERLFDHVFNLRCNFAGRMLWQLGTGAKYNNSYLNCWNTSMTEPEDFCFLFENLMLGGGVGFSVNKENINKLPEIKPGVTVTHENTKDADFIVPDSREGWVELLRQVLRAYFETGKSFTYSTILVRGPGEPIKGFGGTASGPQILIDGIKDFTNILRRREGKKLRPIDVLDLNNILGKIVVSGNVRRCLSYDTKVITETGFKDIKHIKVGDKVMTPNGFKHVTNVFNQGFAQTLAIHTTDGTLECTPEHRVAVMYGIELFKWKQAKDLKPGDKLVFVRDKTKGIDTELPPSDDDTLTIPKLDTEIAWMLGAFSSCYNFDLKLERNKINYLFSPHNATYNKNVVLRMYKIMERFMETRVVRPYKLKKNRYLIKSKVFNYLSKLVNGIHYTTRIPECIVKAKEDIKLAFIRGCIDMTGNIHHRPHRIAKHTSKEFIKDLQALIATRSVESQIKPFTEKNSTAPRYLLLARSARSLAFLRNIFDEKEKLKLLYKTRNVEGYKLDSKWLPQEFIDMFYTGGKFIHIDTYERHMCTELKLIPIEITKIEQGRIVSTYDIEVEDEECFMANNVLVHNSSQIAIGDVTDKEFLTAKNWSNGNIPNWRAMSNNSVVINSFDEIPEEFWEGYKGNGEPYGLININLAKKYGRLKDGPMSGCDLYPTDNDNCTGVNPCQPGFATVLTPDGIRTFDDITIGSTIWGGNKWVKVINKVMTGTKPVYEFITTAGKFVGTEDHYIIEHGKRIKVKNAESIDCAPLPGTTLNKTEKIIEKKYIGDYKVYDITVDSPEHTYWTGGLLVSNCAEITLADGEPCCLSEIYLNNIESKEQLLDCAKLLYKTQKAIMTPNYIHEKTNKIVEKNSRIGIGVTGICQSFEKLEWLDWVYKQLREYDIEWSRLNNYPRSIKMTTVKPSGCQTADTLVPTSKGLLALKEIGIICGDTWQDINIQVEQEEKQAKSTKFFINEGAHPIKRIKLESGIELNSTYDHKYRVIRNGEYVWVEAQNIRPNDSIPYKIGNTKYPDKLVTLPKIPKLFDIKQPTVLDEELAKFIGIVHKNCELWYNYLKIPNHYKYKDYMITAVKKLFGVEHKTYSVNTLFLSKDLVKWLQIQGLSHKNKTIPLALRMSPKHIIDIFIKYALEDGKSRVLSRKYMKELVVLLRYAGYDGTVKNNRVYINHDVEFGKLHFDKVKDIIDDIDYTYDIEVPENHTYIANSVVSHNTLSLLAGATPGVHPAYSKYYIRRVRLSATDELVELCKSAGYPVEYAKQYDGSFDKNTVVVSFPCTSGDNAVLAKDMTAIEQLELVKRLQQIWSDNSVSVTVYYRKEELPKIQKWLEENFIDNLKTVSFLLHSEHGFEQAPYEEITEEQYKEMLSKIDVSKLFANKFSDTLIEGLECEGGVCPVR